MAREGEIGQRHRISGIERDRLLEQPARLRKV
jgi:hypothetical protein